MKELPILFKGPMVNAIIAGVKSQTRRVVKPQWPADAEPEEMSPVSPEGFQEMGHSGLWCDAVTATDDVRKCPYGQHGDLLYVKEAWCAGRDDAPVELTCKPSELNPDKTALYYRAAETPIVGWKWRPSIFMPKWAARIWLRVFDVRVERLQEISEADAVAEGIICGDETWKTRPDGSKVQTSDHGWYVPDGKWERHNAPTHAFRALWDSINAHPKPVYSRKKITHYVSYPWEDIQETRTHRGLPWYVWGNPLVWRVEFERTER